MDKKLKKEKKEKKERIREEENKKVKPPFRPWIDKPKRGEVFRPSNPLSLLLPSTPPPSLHRFPPLHQMRRFKSFSPSCTTPIQTLVPSLEAYDCLFPMTCEWPPPSFDVMEHKKGDKKSFPAALKIVVGTQVCRTHQHLLLEPICTVATAMCVLPFVVCAAPLCPLLPNGANLAMPSVLCYIFWGHILRLKNV